MSSLVTQVSQNWSPCTRPHSSLASSRPRPSNTTPAPDTQLVCFVLGYSRLWLGDQEPGERCVLTNLLLIESAFTR